MNLALSAEQQEIRRLARDFAEREVKPRAETIDHSSEFPAGLVRKAAELGLTGILVPEQYGGAALDHVAFAIVIEELARFSAATAVILDVHGSVATEPVILAGSEEQRKHWLPRLGSGEVIGAFALTEPEAGSDAAHLQMRATRKNGGYLLNGTKIFITNAGHAGLYVAFATVDPGAGAGGITAFLVDGDNPGLHVGPPFKKMGLNGSAICEVHFENCLVRADQRLGEEGDGFKIAMRALDSGRIGISAQAIGLAQGALDDALAYANERKQFGKKIGDFQTIQNKLADMAVKIKAARWMTWRAAARCDAGLPFTTEASMAKLYATDMAMEVTLDALQVFGGYGYLEEYPMARRVRDAKACQIYEGTNQVQRVVIARDVMAVR
jgi:alkylation response protein AidB-like acyl-CoA dehydrogenase